MNEPVQHRSPVDAGPIVRLPWKRLALAAVGGIAATTAVAALIAWNLRQGPGALSAVAGGAGAALAHAVAGVMEQPWKPRALGRWAFTIMHVSLGSILVVLAWIGLLYSAPQFDAVSLALAAAGAWFGGLLAKVAAFGSFAKDAESNPSRFDCNHTPDATAPAVEETRHDVSADGSRSK